VVQILLTSGWCNYAWRNPDARLPIGLGYEPSLRCPMVMSAKPAPKPPVITLATVFSFLLAVCSSSATEWPQYRGGNHDGTSVDRIQKQWANTGPREVWRVPCTNGLSSFAVAGGRALTQIRRSAGAEDREVCVCLDIKTGKEIWAADIGPAEYNGGVGRDDGPRSTPTLQGDRAYVLSSFLVLCCLDARTGASLWSKDLVSLYGGSVIGWQNAASPLLEDDLIFVNCNSPSQSLLALKAADGTLAWRSQSERMTQSTPVSVVLLGLPQVIFASQTGLVSLNRTNGTRLWKAPYPFTYSTSLAASPLVHSNIVFLSANYSMGSFASRVSRSGDSWTATPIWTNASYKAHWMSSVAHDGFIFGLFGSSTSASLKCLDLLSGTQKWSVAGFGCGGTILVDKALMILSEKGDLVLVEPTPSAYSEKARWTVFQNYDPDANKCWNVPTVSDGMVYLRSTAEAACLDLSTTNLKLITPWLSGSEIRFAITTSNGQPIAPDRLATLTLLSSADLAIPLDQWSPFQSTLQLTNGIVLVTVPCDLAQRFFIVTESQ
jgi:outer membrane protein assembly factor BamB